jgi:hypothetical protein
MFPETRKRGARSRFAHRRSLTFRSDIAAQHSNGVTLASLLGLARLLSFPLSRSRKPISRLSVVTYLIKTRVMEYVPSSVGLCAHPLPGGRLCRTPGRGSLGSPEPNY